jgi:hypothetical protein
VVYPDLSIVAASVEMGVEELHAEHPPSKSFDHLLVGEFVRIFWVEFVEVIDQ